MDGNRNNNAIDRYVEDLSEMGSVSLSEQFMAPPGVDDENYRRPQCSPTAAYRDELESGGGERRGGVVRGHMSLTLKPLSGSRCQGQRGVVNLLPVISRDVRVPVGLRALVPEHLSAPVPRLSARDHRNHGNAELSRYTCTRTRTTPKPVPHRLSTLHMYDSDSVRAKRNQTNTASRVDSTDYDSDYDLIGSGYDPALLADITAQTTPLNIGGRGKILNCRKMKLSVRSPVKGQVMTHSGTDVTDSGPRPDATMVSLTRIGSDYAGSTVRIPCQRPESCTSTDSVFISDNYSYDINRNLY